MKRADLHHYQERMVDWIVERPYCALYAEMGLGKTAATLTAIRDLLNTCEISRVLVVAPLRVALNTWPAEIAKWAHTADLTYTILHGPSRLTRLNEDTDIHIVNRENVVWLWEHWGKDWPYDLVVIDEASSFKSYSAKRFKAMMKARKHVDRLVELTGTPASNGLLDLWPQIALLDRGERLGRNITAYRRRWFDSDYMGYTWSPRENAEAEIHARLADICLTMRAEDYLDVPPVIHNDIAVTLPVKAARQYAELEKEFLIEIEDETVTAATAAVLSNKLLQMANGALYTDEYGSFEEVHDAKIEALREIVEANPGEPILVATNFVSDRVRIRKAFPDAEMLDNDYAAIMRWNAGKTPMLLAHPASAGHGLNLQDGGHILVWFGLNWSLELYDQMNARLHRQGQSRPTIIHRIVAGDTVDETVIRALAGKAITQNALLDALREDASARQGMRKAA